MANDYYLGDLGSEEMLSAVDRTPPKETPLEIKRETRLASGKLVRDVIATKRVFSFSWHWLPGQDSDVEDSGLGRDSLRDLYDDGGSYNLMVPLETGGHDSVTVYFDNYSEERARVGSYYLWNVDFTLVEE